MKSPLNLRFWLLAFVLVAAPGCESLWINQGRILSVTAAGQAGLFHRQTGRWPQSRNQLIERGCREIDDATFEDAVIESAVKSGPPKPVTGGCQFFVNLPYQLELQPHATYLRMVLRDGSGKLVCRLRVAVPAQDGRDALAPQITLTTTWFACPGEGESM